MLFVGQTSEVLLIKPHRGAYIVIDPVNHHVSQELVQCKLRSQTAVITVQVIQICPRGKFLKDVGR